MSYLKQPDKKLKQEMSLLTICPLIKKLVKLKYLI